MTSFMGQGSIKASIQDAEREERNRPAEDVVKAQTT
jgi:hypothetical protein